MTPCQKQQDRRHVFKHLLLFVTILLFEISAVRPSRNPTSEEPGWSWFRRTDAAREKQKWSSLFTVDPSKILRTLIHRGGLLIPKSIEKDLHIIASVCNVEQAALNVVDKMLLLSNFTVAMPGGKDTLRVRKVYVCWDSYHKPCIDIEVEDVDLFVEFTNLMLTKNSWNELNDYGFPPAMTDSTEKTRPDDKSQPSFFRIGAIQFEGNVTAHVGSRPLGKELGSISFDMKSLDELYGNIRDVSARNIKQTGRRGCTTEQLYDIIQQYFTEKLKAFAAATARDIAAGGIKLSPVERSMQLADNAKNAITKYAGEAGKKTGEDLGDLVFARLEKMGIPSFKEKLSNAKNILNTNVVGKENLEQSVKGHVKDVYTSSLAAGADPEKTATTALNSVEKTKEAEAEEDLDNIFPDW